MLSCTRNIAAEIGGGGNAVQLSSAASGGWASEKEDRLHLMYIKAFGRYKSSPLDVIARIGKNKIGSRFGEVGSCA